MAKKKKKSSSGGKGGTADLSAWLAVGAGVIGAFMATLDTSIVNASLPTIQGEIGANPSEGTWVSTGYLVSEIIMIALAGWLDRVLGLRTFLLICVSLFTAFSVWCGLSGSLSMMIAGRVGQGFFGGALIPTALTIVATRLPPAQRPIGVSLFGGTAVLGPVLGPIVGGWLTENLSWHYAFFLNLPIGLGLIVLLMFGLPHSKSRLHEFARADGLGILGLICGLGGLTIVLEEGQQDRWFESEFIRVMSAISAFGFVCLLVGQLVARRPVIHLKILLTRQFGSVFVMSLSVGAALYGLNYMLPQFLTTFADYNAEQSGLTAFVSGVPSMLMIGFFPFFVRYVDVRAAIGFGLFLYGVACLMNIHNSPETSGPDFTVRQWITGFGQFFTFLFLNQVAANSVPMSLADDASGLFNAARNLGGSFGLAAISTFRERWTTWHQTELSAHITANSVVAQDYMRQSVSAMGHGDPVVGLQRTYSSLSQQIQANATALAYNDLFMLFATFLFLCIPLVFLIKPLPKDAEMTAG